MQKQLPKHQHTGIVLAVSVLAFFMFFNLIGCAQQVSIRDVAGMSPYEAKQLLEQDISDAQVDFVTVKGTEVTVDNNEHYSGWEVIATEPSTEDSKKILATIRMTDLEAEKRNAIISDHIQREVVAGWPEGSITYHDSDELLILRYQSSVPSYTFQATVSDVPSEHNLAESLRGTILTTYYTSDNYLVGITYNSHQDVSSDQLERAKNEAKRIMEEADEYAARHLGELILNFVDYSFTTQFGDQKSWSMHYTQDDGGVGVEITMPTNKSFVSAQVPDSHKQAVEYWSTVANFLTKYTRTNVVFRIYSSSGDLEIMAGATEIRNYTVSDELKDVLPATPDIPFLPM